MAEEPVAMTIGLAELRAVAGGLPPYASVYPTWVDCWRHLSLEGNMSRGNSLFFRKLPAGKTYALHEKRFF
ncbi:hypothetical protein JZ751_011539 [Albula glossodonta]|uniref:Uncharacterized protein n=1 Tax=Albula glossodonta TaxID=121402 RepID=A0A8T2N1Z9_9TELE|nr:hypothetical protein JZ751_011539 [Albula glossodonta]